ncbi:MAG: hypothetical protein EZS28_042972 [Streblomastix strix]|uniref:Uncharacterized protein n=1 Tax=Streblomastix strix TaxID=222440 RepID=A0A5J4TVA3_9EUKA|nr:MAG: hypothetical protein EZS28_042972 [Streblomastix strix]
MMNLSYTDRTQEIINDSKISHDEKFKFDLNQQLNEQQQQQQEYLTEEYLAARNSESEEDAHFFAEFMSKLESLLGDAKDQKQRMKVLSSEETIEIQNVGEYMEKRRIKNENFKNQLEQEIEEMNKINKFKEKDAKIKLKLMEKRVNQAELTGEIDEKQAIEDVNNEELGEFQIIQTDQQQQLNQTAQKDKSGNALKKQSSSSSLKKQTSTSSLLSTPSSTQRETSQSEFIITSLAPSDTSETAGFIIIGIELVIT